MKRLTMVLLITAIATCAVAQDPSALNSNTSGLHINYNPAFARAKSIGSMIAPTGQMKPQLARLEQQASAGDVSAAKQLFAGLSRCQGESLQANKGVFAQNCEGISESDYAGMGKWLTEAARAGDSQAQYAYAVVGIDYVLGVQQAEANPAAFASYKETAKGYLFGLAKTCNIDATQAIASDAAGTGLLFGDDLSDGYKFAVVTERIQNHSVDKDNNSAIAINAIKQKIARKISDPQILSTSAQSADAFAEQYCK